MGRSPRQPGRVPLALVCAVVLTFRVAAWRWPSAYVLVPDSVALPLGLLGIVYLASGVWAWLARPSPLTRVFLASGIGGGVHWGGTVAPGNTEGEIALLVFYLAITAIGDGAFLDLALRYPEQRGRSWAWIFYVLGIVTFIAIPIAPFVAQAAVETGAGIVITVAFLMSIAGGVVFLVKWIRATAAMRRASFLTPIVLAMVAPSALDLLADGGLLPGVAEAWSLAYAAVPITLAWGLTRH